MSLNRRAFALASAGIISGLAPSAFAQDEKEKATEPATPKGPIEADFERDYEPPKFKPSWKNKQINRSLAQDFVIYAHSDLKMIEMLLKREPGLVNAAIDWGNGDYETGLGGASHMGRRDIVAYLLKNGARIDIFCAAMMGLTDVVKTFLTLEPTLIDAKGPHGLSLHFHAQVGQEQAKPVLDYLQSVKEMKLRPVPWLRRKKPAGTKKPAAGK